MPIEISTINGVWYYKDKPLSRCTKPELEAAIKALIKVIRDMQEYQRNRPTVIIGKL